MSSQVQSIVEKYGKDATRLMDIFIDIFSEYGCVNDMQLDEIGELLNISKVDVEQTLSFYHFFNKKSCGKYAIYLNDSLVANMMGRHEIAQAFEKATKTKFGSVSADGLFGLYNTSCIGMNDQEPAAIINGIVFPKITTYRVRELIREFRTGKSAEDMVNSFGGGQNQSELIRSMVTNNLNRRGSVIFADYNPGDVLNKLPELKPAGIIEEVKNSNLRGRGGAGFPTGLKWDFCTKSPGDERYLICNADEGEPGTFKDRVILTETPHLLFEGMIVAGYAIGAKEGIIYLRYEYDYLKHYLEAKLDEFRSKGWLGKDASGIKGFNYDIRIQFGAGAYVCGEESALIESCEGKRGEPRNRPPFPVQVGYLNKPTVVNNVETLCSVVKIIMNGANWYKSMGTKETSGTKLLSISGDVRFPGVFEIEWGMTVNEMLEMAGASGTKAVQIGGPSGRLIAENEFERTICYEDLPTGGAMIVIGKERNILDVVLNFTEFFIEESCGSCAPCRYLTVILRNKLQKIISGKGVAKDIDDLVKWGKQMKNANRCGLGQSAANPILTSIENFRAEYEAKIEKGKDFDTNFNLDAAIQESSRAVGRFPLA
ncbi:MAG: NAD(P)H-dependent oxidoreductase subunit E [Bacteroidales bacterium]|nr:NAD(P)H-dependent oxidoreductase subunit E [Bacteroidales bacterium]MCF8403878.1 NAD(P)H-dependent oxidoreductase subunit E [Bacteroidales bacterium]